MEAVTAPAQRRAGFTRLQWVICVIASIGFAFDTYELLMLPLIVRPALMDLTPALPDSAEFSRWVGILFYVPAIAGGIFGVLGGYLTDRLGRRQVLVWSILLYAVSACGSAYASSVGVARGCRRQTRSAPGPTVMAFLPWRLLAHAS